MKKKKVILTICISLFVLGILSICLFFAFGKNEKVIVNNNNEANEKVSAKEGYDEFGNKIVEVFDSQDAVYNEIVNEYLAEGETILNTKEENGCWYYTSSNGREVYEYCVNDPVIRVIVREYIDIK